MVRVMKFFAYFLFFMLALMYFMPKESIYHFAEKELQKQGVVIAHETVQERGLSLEIEHLQVYVKSIESATIDSVKISFFGLYNDVYARNIVLSDAVASMLPVKIASVNINYSILHPQYILLNAAGDFGKMQMKVDLFHREIHAYLHAASIMQRRYRATLGNFKRIKNGEYEYVQSF